jgi:hypothetical protein
MEAMASAPATPAAEDAAEPVAADPPTPAPRRAEPEAAPSLAAEAPPVRLRRDGEPDRRMKRRTTATAKKKAASRRAPAGTAPRRPEPLPAPQNPTVARLVAELDTEIAALQRERTVLVEAC